MTTIILVAHISVLILTIILISKCLEKKRLKTTLILLLSLLIIYLLSLSIDVFRVNNLKTPVFAIKQKSNCINECYNGLGYKVFIQYYNEDQIEKTEMTILNKVIASSIVNIQKMDVEETKTIVDINNPSYKKEGYEYSFSAKNSQYSDDVFVIYFHNFDDELKIGDIVKIVSDYYDLNDPTQATLKSLEVVK